MDALIMAGGKGTRLEENVEKPILDICGKPMIDYVIESLLNSEIEKIYVAVSNHTPKTKQYLEKKYSSDQNYNQKINIICTSGSDYVDDLNECIEFFREPFLILSSDIPTIKTKVINSIIKEYLIVNNSCNRIESFCVVTKQDDYVGTPSIDMGGYIPLGINILTPKYGEQTEILHVVKDIIVNVNTLSDKKLVETLINKVVE
ncbi:adenosylcobinamide-phosphate guanylyltransferase [Methanococcus maripaludis C5]|uniref:Adenosylcobinamide-phosphate guanylyltransferase n=1 Tax=Methanococcus maripaludis (strain C5 / ATCC BAA-1333) TaxID=402880 RepID=A4FXU8_METM5|nr:adenosylcobinamide-phosphate guanylyltransferase [Methanococcus maripaludis]ABO35032.1 adenosylcobinamide-phosphate guanylyltransferase [Methanococcus maripaludis C5]